MAHENDADHVSSRLAKIPKVALANGFTRQLSGDFDEIAILFSVGDIIETTLNRRVT